MPLFLPGNSTPTILHSFRNLQCSKFPYGCADLAEDSGRKGSNVYEINQLPVLCIFGRGKACLRGLSVFETDKQQMAVIQEGAGCGHAIPKGGQCSEGSGSPMRRGMNQG